MHGSRLKFKSFQQPNERSRREGGESLTNISLWPSPSWLYSSPWLPSLGIALTQKLCSRNPEPETKWNEYQAKKIRSDQVNVAIDLLALQPSGGSPASSKKLEEYRAHEEKWKDDLREEQNKARELEAEVTKAERQASRFDLGEALLQIAVVLCSITLFTRKRLYFFAGLSIGAAGLLFAASAALIR